MRPLLVLTISTLALGGCVTENSYNGSDKPVVENKINSAGAARTRIALALQYLNTGNNSQAKYNLERASEYAPNLPEVHYSLAYYYQQVGENKLADLAYQKALAIKPDDPNTLNNYGVFLCGIDEYDRATDQFLKAIAIPSYIRVAQSYENLALCAIEFDDFDNAETYFQQAINHSSQRASTLISLAALYYAKSDLYKASALLKRYDDTAQISPRALLLSYLIKQRMGKIEEAEKIAATILQTYPSSDQAFAIRDSQIKQTEFEVLREKYRQAQLNELKQDGSEAQLSSQPKIKIIRKKRPSQNDSTSLISANKTPVATVTDPAAVIAEVKPVLPSSKTVAPPSQANAVLNAKPITNSTNQSSKQAIVSPLSAQPETPPSTLPAAQAAANNNVKIISFGAPQPAINSANKANTTNTTFSQASAQPSNNGQVVFYKPTKNADVFASNNSNELDTIELRNAPTSNDNKLPMLNPKVAPLTVPFHIIEFGENLFSISVRYNVKLQKLLLWNGLKESDRVMNGSKIYLNDPNIYYEIKAGDTLFEIATQRQVLIDELMRWNKLSPDIALTPGHNLLLVDPDSYLL